ncbi:MAG: methyl-accepting chemotaxis protein [Bacteroidetes bacterium]|nr:methyl-accepting chemotaxis protein [Bacteroidota bacterium]
MKIGVKITLLVAAAVVGIIVVSAVSLVSLNKLSDMFTFLGEKSIKNAEIANKITDDVNLMARNTAMSCVDTANTDTRMASVDSLSNSVSDGIAALENNNDDRSLDGLIKELRDALTNQAGYRKLFVDYIISHNFDAARELRKGDYQDAINKTSSLTVQITEYMTKESYRVAEEVSIAEVSSSKTMLIACIVIVAIVLVILAIVIITGITKPLKKAVESLDKIASGDFDVNLETNSNDETGMLLKSMDNMVSNLNGMSSDLHNLIKNAFEGNLKYRADANKHQGDFKKMITDINELVGVFVEPLNIAANFLDGIAKGDANIQKVTKDFKGELVHIKNNINQTHDTLFAFLGEVNTLVDGAKAGNISLRADTSKAQGAWAMMMGGVNEIVDASEKIINDAGRTLEIMATGDLTPRITANYPGKFGDMKNNINNLGDSLTDLVSQLQEAIHTTASASAEISSTADTLAAATQEQSSQTDEVATAMEEMSRTVTDNAQSATQTANVAKQSGDTATSGGKVVEQTISKMKEIAEVVKISANNIAKLGESSKKIGDIISVIDDIADQTNLLSLNAAIEAARAGEQGRGFAVVADSVGKLAVSTASATKEIADMIKGIQVDTEAAVKAMEKGTLEVQSGIELADNAGKSINDILLGINDLLDMVNQIAAASEQQSATSEQISKNVSSISKVTADSARNVEDVASTANELARMTETLTALVSQFKIGASSHHALNSGGNNRYLN